MTDSPPTPVADVWRHAHEAARTLHDALAQIGVPERELEKLTARSGPAAPDRPRVHIPPLSPASTALLLAALLPSLGPEYLGRVTAAPAGHPS